MFAVELCTRAGAPLGPVHDAKQIGVNRGVKIPRTSRLQLAPGNTKRQIVRGAPGVLAKVYDVDDLGVRRLRHIGPLTSYERTADAKGATVQLGSTDAAWYLDRRITNITNPALNVYERGLVMKWIVMLANGQPVTDPSYLVGLISDTWDNFYVDEAWPGPAIKIWSKPALTFDTGIRPRTIASTPTLALESTPVAAKISTLFAQCSAGLSGPDWAVYPSEPTADTYGVRIGHLDVAPVIGANKPNVLFEFGVGKHNVDAYREVLDPSGMVNMVVATTSTFEDYFNDSTAFLANGVLQDYIAVDVPQGPLTNQLLQDHIAVRKQPKQVVTFTLITDPEPGSVRLEERRVPRPEIDFDFGDVVTFTAVEQVPVLDSDGTVIGETTETAIAPTLMRVYNIDEADDDQGRRTVTITVVAS